MNDLTLLAAAWIKGELAQIGSTALSQCDAVGEYVADVPEPGLSTQDESRSASCQRNVQPLTSEEQEADEFGVHSDDGFKVGAHRRGPLLLRVIDLETFEQCWANLDEEMPFEEIHIACAAGLFEPEVVPWLLSRWSLAKTQLHQQAEQVAALLGSKR